MGVQLGVAGAAGAVPEPGGDEPAAGQPAGPELGRAAAVAARLFDPRRTKQASRSSQPTASSTARVERLDDLAAHQRVGQRVQHRHRFRRRERQVEPRHPPLPGLQPVAVRGLAGARIQPGEHRPQVLAGRPCRDSPSAADGVAQPASGHLALAGVVVVEALGDLAQVVGLGPDPQLPQRQHPTRTSTPADPKHAENVAAGGVVQHLGARV